MVVRPKIQAQVGTKEYLLEEQAIYDKAIEQHDWTTVWECLYNATNRYLMWRLKKRDFKKTAAMDDKIVRRNEENAVRGLQDKLPQILFLFCA